MPESDSSTDRSGPWWAEHATQIIVALIGAAAVIVAALIAAQIVT